MLDVAGDGACFVNPYDVTSIRSGIVRVIEDRGFRTQLVSAGIRNAIRFDARVVANQYLNVYTEILSGAFSDSSNPTLDRNR
jgi:glycosyltransferase involved in cell wall biosynthesis